MAVRLIGVSLPDKRIEIALTYVFGIGNSLSRKILEKANIDKNIRTNKLSDDEVEKIRKAITELNIHLEGDLKREVSSNIKRLKEIGTYRGSRHSKGLPCRGQRTKTNSRTVRGNVRKTMGSGRKPAAQKT